MAILFFLIRKEMLRTANRAADSSKKDNKRLSQQKLDWPFFKPAVPTERQTHCEAVVRCCCKQTYLEKPKNANFHPLHRSANVSIFKVSASKH